MTSFSKHFSFFGVLLLMTAILLGSAQAQEKGKKKKKTRHRIEYYNFSDSLKYFQSHLYVSEKGVKTEIEGATVKFFALSDTGEVFISESITDATGKANLIIREWTEFPTDSFGTLSVVAKFDGNESYKEKEVDIEVRDIELTIDYLEEDSVRTILVKAVNPANEEKVAGIKIKFYVKRLFSPLLIEGVSTDKKGKAVLEFPSDIPGDEAGILGVLVKMEDDRDFGNFEEFKKLAWGVPIEKVDEESERALWSQNAPMWMVVSFIILMVTVWGHYIAIMAILLKIKKDKKNETSKILWDS